MPVTPRAALRYPDGSQPPAGMTQIQALAEDVDAQLGSASCTSAARPTTGNFAGRTMYETDTGCLIRWSGTAWTRVGVGAWRAWSPTVSGIPGSTAGSSWRYVGEGIQARLAFTASGASTGGITVPLPVSSGTYQAGWHTLGVAALRDVSPGQYWMGQAGAVLGSAGPVTSIAFYTANSGSSTLGTSAGSSAPFAWASGDTISAKIEYDL